MTSTWAKSARALRTLPVLACACLCSSCGPHMVSQPAIRPYKAQMPAMPANTVPTRGTLASITTVQSQVGANPVPPTPQNLDNGRIYYGYYCAMCHGAKGDGNGPVGQSYIPKPTDLTSPTVAALPDGELYRRMLHGVGHDPVLDQTVIPAHRWPIVSYVKTLSKGPR